MKTPNLKAFVSQPWRDGYGKSYRDMVFEFQDPEHKIPFSNIITMRTAKYLDWLDMQNIRGIKAAYIQCVNMKHTCFGIFLELFGPVLWICV